MAGKAAPVLLLLLPHLPTGSLAAAIERPPPCAHICSQARRTQEYPQQQQQQQQQYWLLKLDLICGSSNPADDGTCSWTRNADTTIGINSTVL
jgi:hypothetical protein